MDHTMIIKFKKGQVYHDYEGLYYGPLKRDLIVEIVDEKIDLYIGKICEIEEDREAT